MTSHEASWHGAAESLDGMGVAWLHINGWVDQIGFGGPFGAKPGPPERFPLDRASAIAARVIARAFEIPGVHQFVFNAMLVHSDRQRKKQ